jgi:hypothetical protein
MARDGLLAVVAVWLRLALERVRPCSGTIGERVEGGIFDNGLVLEMPHLHVMFAETGFGYIQDV